MQIVMGKREVGVGISISHHEVNMTNIFVAFPQYYVRSWQGINFGANR